MAKFVDLTGQRFGRLTVISRAENTKDGKARWLCECDCGNKTIVTTDSLKSGHTYSCDCLRRERSALALSKIASKQTGSKNPAYKHGCTGSKLYHVWAEMIQRCTNVNHRRYRDWGGRGIKVCDEWLKDYACFQEWALAHGYKQGLSIDRINNDGNYEPSNCRWVTTIIQNQNKRKYRKKDI